MLSEVSSKTRKIIGKGKVRIGLVDCGVKWNIIRKLVELKCEVEILPWNTPLQDVDCSGWLISNGPGNPMLCPGVIDQIKWLLSFEKPILGICLGHQLLAIAAGALTSRMQFGHRSHNQPVVDLISGRGYLTSQNHGYTVDPETVPDSWGIWFQNANDASVEGLYHKTKAFRSVQFHPEASGGPWDTNWIFSSFIEDVVIKNK